MDNYIINNNTIAILKENKKTIIYNVDNIKVINKNIKKVLEDNCNFYGSSLNGRKKSAKIILNIKYKVPISISNDNNYILLQIDSLRNKKCLFIMLNKIIDYKIIDNILTIICLNNNNFKINISKYSFEKMFINGIKLNNILKWRKNTNIV